QAQMNEMAASCAAENTNLDNETRDMQLLSQRVLRNESTLHEVYDGALFAFVEATDPEIFFMLEVRSIHGEPQWHYGLARMNSIRLSASFDEKTIWTAEMLPWSEALNRADLSYTAFTIR